MPNSKYTKLSEIDLSKYIYTPKLDFHISLLQKRAKVVPLGYTQLRRLGGDEI
jgi:hypothetical protein